MKKEIGKLAVKVLIALVIVIGLIGSDKIAHKHKQRADKLEQTVTDLNQKIKYTKIMMDDSIALYQAEVKNLSYTKANLQAKYDRLLKASELKPKDVQSVTEVASVIHSVDTVIAEVDTFGGLKAKMLDPFVNINVEVFPDRLTIIDYRVRDSLTIVHVQKQHSILWGLIKWKKPKGIRVINHNPKAEITDVRHVEVIE